VAKFVVETDVLLESIAGGIPQDDDARIVVSVNLRPQAFKWENMGFLQG
jgi:hypothetical protein